MSTEEQILGFEDLIPKVEALLYQRKKDHARLIATQMKSTGVSDQEVKRKPSFN